MIAAKSWGWHGLLTKPISCDLLIAIDSGAESALDGEDHRDTRQPTGTRTRRGAVVATAALLSTVRSRGCTSASAARLDARKALRAVGGDRRKRVAQLTGHDSLNHTARFEIAGQDLGSMFEADGKTWFVFGDTFGQREAGLTGGGGTEWRSNALAYTTDTDPSDGIRFDGYIADEIGLGQGADRLARRSTAIEMTVDPDLRVRGQRRDVPGLHVGEALGRAGGVGDQLRRLRPSTDGGQTWTKLDGPALAAATATSSR